MIIILFLIYRVYFQDLDIAREEIDSLNRKIEQLTKTIGDCDHEADNTQKYLIDEISKIKQQKAELRCQMLKTQQELRQLQNQLHVEEKQNVCVNDYYSKQNIIFYSKILSTFVNK